MTFFRRITATLSLALLCVITVTTSVKADNRDEIIFFFNDALGSAVAAVNEAGELCWDEVYTPYGEKSINNDLVNVTGCGIVGEERGFTGHTEDVNSDLVYMQQRYYDPTIGRFLSIDPLDANPNNPMTYNRYAYANNNPYSYVDPDGEIPVLAWGVYVGVTAALTAYDNYQAYQEGGASALAGEVAIGAAMSMIPGGRITKSTLGAAADVADGVGNVAKKGLRYELKPQDKDWRGTGKTHKDALDDAFKQTGIDRSEFTVTKWGRDANGKSFAAEYRHKSGAEVNIDWAHSKNGPDAPHVGWQTAGKRGNGGAVRGHTILDSVPYNR